MINEIQKQIDKTNYWDLLVFDVQSKYFGDEVDVFIENDKKTCWKISFFSCYKVNYKTDANWRNIDNVKEMRGGQLGYYGQDISLGKYKENEEFIQCSLDLSIMTMNIVCKNIVVEKVKIEDISFFWQKNE